MASGFKNPITIKDAIDKIQNRFFLLPAIQRKFTWSSTQIEMLFDSILRGYPINSFMMWKITDSKIKKDYKFYEFLIKYKEFFAVNNPEIDTIGANDFDAVIDGQQRLTSLYIGLRGTYAYRLPRKWLKETEECMPTRKLYLNLEKPVSQMYDNQKKYDFRFLCDDDLKKWPNQKGEYYWFLVRDIVDLDNTNKIMSFLAKEKLFDNAYACETLSNLYESIHVRPLINYYCQEEQEADKVLDIFIRTNSGGTPLTFSDLLMSIASANWKNIDARKEIEEITKQIYGIGRPAFVIDKDFILKTCLVLFIDNIKFQLKNFTYDNVAIFEKNWAKIKDSIIAAFTLFEKMGFNNATFRAKNAAIPIIYYIYYKDLAADIVKANYDPEDKKAITKWLTLSFIKGIFGGQPDSVLITMRKVLKSTTCDKFPVQELMDAFKNNPSKNYLLDDEFLNGLTEAKKDSNDAFYVLLLMYPNLDYYNQDFHQDHLHPKTIFENRGKFESSIPAVDWEYACKESNWNSVANLQLLNNLKNASKQDTPLKDWAANNNISNEDLFVSPTTSLEIADFKSFIENRRLNIKNYLKTLI